MEIKEIRGEKKQLEQKWKQIIRYSWNDFYFRANFDKYLCIEEKNHISYKCSVFCKAKKVGSE